MAHDPQQIALVIIMASATPKVCGVNIASSLAIVGKTISLNLHSRLPYNANHGTREPQEVRCFRPPGRNSSGEISTGIDVAGAHADARGPNIVAESRNSFESRLARSRARQH